MAPTRAERALTACLRHLPHSITEGGAAQVLRAWTDSHDSFCVVYTVPFWPTALGLRRTLHQAMDGGPVTDPERFGRDVADFDIGEPLGSAADRLRTDTTGVQWRGDLGELLP